MPRPAFSSKFRLWGEWLANANKSSSYVKKIIALHKQFPDKSLKALKDIGKTVIPLSKAPAKALTSSQMQERRAALQIIHSMQPSNDYKGMSLRKAISYHNNNPTNIKMSEKKVKAHLGDLIVRKVRFTINPNGKLETTHNILSNGERHEITVSTQKERNLLKDYFWDIWREEHGKMSKAEFSEKWSKKIIKDSSGKTWRFESNPKAIEDIKEREEVDYIVSYSR